MTDTDTYIQKLKETHPLREPVIRAAIQALRLPQGSHGLDAGCGIGFQCLMLAEAVGPKGHITGLDINPDFLRHAEEIVKKSGRSEQITFQKGDVERLPFEDDTFDWVWSADCVGYPVANEPLLLLNELARIAKPGSIVAILAYSSQSLLPGYPLLEARLNATCSAYIPIVKGKRPEMHFLRALGWLQKAGLAEPTVQTFVGDVHAPLKEGIRDGLTSLFDQLWGTKQPGVTEEDWVEYQRLCRPQSSDFILNLPDYYAFFTYSMFSGKVPE